MEKIKYHLYGRTPGARTVSSTNPIWYIRTISPWLFRHTLCSIKFHDLVDAIKEGRAIAISDGSHKNKWGSVSWRIMADTNEDEQWAGLHVKPGRNDDESAFRSEIWGIYAMAVAIELICRFFHISNGSVSFGSDCQVALYYIFDWNKKPHQQQILLI
jgi:hypothetical protein